MIRCSPFILLTFVFTLMVFGGCENRQPPMPEDPLHPILVTVQQVDGKLDAQVVNDSEEIIDVIYLRWELQPVVDDKDPRKGVVMTNSALLSYWAEVDQAMLYLPARGSSPGYHKREATLGDRVWIYPGASVTFTNVVDLNVGKEFKKVTQIKARVVASIFRNALLTKTSRPADHASRDITVLLDTLAPRP